MGRFECDPHAEAACRYVEDDDERCCGNCREHTGEATVRGMDVVYCDWRNDIYASDDLCEEWR